MWNAARFVVTNLGELSGADALAGWTVDDLSAFSLPQRWIISRLHHLTTSVTQLMDDYQFGEAGRQIYEFLWSEYCDWFIEVSKSDLYAGGPEDKRRAQQVLVYVLERTMRLLHPFMPFVTEEIWRHLTGGKLPEADALIVAPWPAAGPADDAAEADMALLIEIVRAIRNVRAEYDVPSAKRIAAELVAGDRLPLLERQRTLLTEQARLEPAGLRLERELAQKPAHALTLVIGGVEVYIPLAGMLDLAAERLRLEAEIGHLEAEIARVDKLLANPGFTGKAPAEVVERERNKRVEHVENIEKLRRRRQALD
jgi:valyl-tRNA synthetase